MLCLYAFQTTRLYTTITPHATKACGTPLERQTALRRNQRYSIFDVACEDTQSSPFAFNLERVLKSTLHQMWLRALIHRRFNVVKSQLLLFTTLHYSSLTLRYADNLYSWVFQACLEKSEECFYFMYLLESTFIFPH